MNGHWQPVGQVLYAGTRHRNVITETPKQPHPQPFLGLHVPSLPMWDRDAGDALHFPLSLKKHRFDVASGESWVTLFHLSEDCMSLLLSLCRRILELLYAVCECKIHLWVLFNNMLKALIHIIIPSSLKIPLKLALFLQHPLKNWRVWFSFV